jgi:hypothetical protein
MSITECVTALHKISHLRFLKRKNELTRHSSMLRGLYVVPTFQNVAEECQRHAAVRKE